jgi:DNA-binding XRE family transcriptional regulator
MDHDEKLTTSGLLWSVVDVRGLVRDGCSLGMPWRVVLALTVEAGDPLAAGAASTSPGDTHSSGDTRSAGDTEPDDSGEATRGERPRAERTRAEPIASSDTPAKRSPGTEPATKRKKKGRQPNNVRKMRIERMVSKAELARRANLSVLTIDRVEKGFGCRMDTKRKILEALGLSLSDRVRVFGEEE